MRKVGISLDFVLGKLFNLQLYFSSDLSTRDILVHPDFKKLCRKLRSQAGAIDLKQTIEALKVVSYVGVPSDSVITQVLLQLIRHNINNLNLQQIMFLDFLLSQFNPSPLVDALKIALPIVFEIQLPVQMDYDNINHLADYLFYASRHRMNEASIEKITNALVKYPQQFDAKTAKSVIWSICDMDSYGFLRPLLKKAINSLVVNLDELSYNDMETTLTKLISRYSYKTNYFYDEVFFDSCINYIIDNDLGYKHSIYTLRKLSRVVSIFQHKPPISCTNNFLEPR